MVFAGFFLNFHMQKEHLYGLAGKNIGHSFSKRYFNEKFESLGLEDHEYVNFEIEDISLLPEIVKRHPNLKGLNVTIPYKESVIPQLTSLSKKAMAIGAVNTIRILADGKLKGYNTDWYGFRKAIKPLLEPHHRNALILGTGGASKAIAYVLTDLDIKYTFVSRNDSPNHIPYERLNATIFDNYQIIINTTPVGTWPDVTSSPKIPYEFLTPKHIAFDLIYNPEETQFMKNAKQFGAKTSNGYDMLVFQAEKAWRIWHK